MHQNAPCGARVSADLFSDGIPFENLLTPFPLGNPKRVRGTQAENVGFLGWSPEESLCCFWPNLQIDSCWNQGTMEDENVSHRTVSSSLLLSCVRVSGLE